MTDCYGTCSRYTPFRAEEKKMDKCKQDLTSRLAVSKSTGDERRETRTERANIALVG